MCICHSYVPSPGSEEDEGDISFASFIVLREAGLAVRMTRWVGKRQECQTSRKWSLDMLQPKAGAWGKAIWWEGPGR
jgi:hypothetical protein